MPNDSQKLKQLRTRNSKVSLEIGELKRDKEKAEAALTSARAEATKIKKSIHDLTQKKDPIVTEHAILRYLERIEGIDLEEVKKKILTDKVKGFIEQLPNGVFPVVGLKNFKIKVKNRVVITILDR